MKNTDPPAVVATDDPTRVTLDRLGPDGRWHLSAPVRPDELLATVSGPQEVATVTPPPRRAPRLALPFGGAA